ncbi:MAG: DUF4321 domain-containing protein [Elusimicrobia bacterium]|nr:DUF4321 domain-containing protein [Elusimicrobiota bacterium]
MRALEVAAVLVGGALLGGFLGKLFGLYFTEGRVHDWLLKPVVAGLHPTHLDLVFVDLTLGFLIKLNVLGIIGIIVAAILYKKILK